MFTNSISGNRTVVGVMNRGRSCIYGKFERVKICRVVYFYIFEPICCLLLDCIARLEKIIRFHVCADRFIKYLYFNRLYSFVEEIIDRVH